MRPIWGKAQLDFCKPGVSFSPLRCRSPPFPRSDLSKNLNGGNKDGGYHLYQRASRMGAKMVGWTNVHHMHGHLSTRDRESARARDRIAKRINFLPIWTVSERPFDECRACRTESRFANVSDIHRKAARLYGIEWKAVSKLRGNNPPLGGSGRTEIGLAGLQLSGG